MNYSNQTISAALPIYGQHLAESTGVKVVVGGTRAYTNGETVNVPVVKDGDASLAFGFIAHECSHVRNTDMAAVREAAPIPFRRTLLNILEDIRIERLSMDQYPGTEGDIRYLNRKVLLEPFKPENMGTSIIAVVHGALLMGTYWKLQEPQLEVPGKAYIAALEGMVGKALADQIMDIACRCIDCSTTQEVLVLVDEILALIPNQDEDDASGSEQDDSEDESSDGTDEDSGTDNSGEDDSSESSSGSDGESDSQEGADEGGAGGDTGSEDSQDQDASGGQGGSDQGEQDGDEANAESTSQQEGGAGRSGMRDQLMSATEEDLKGLISDIGDEAGRLINAEANSQGVERVLPLAGRTQLRNDYHSSCRVEYGRQQSAGLRQVLNGLLQSKVDTRVRLKRQGKRLDTSRIAMLRAGESRVFRSKARAVRESAAVQILLDKSGSMSQSMAEAEAAVYAVLRSLEGLPLVTSGAMAFPNGENLAHEEGCALIKAHSESLAAAVLGGGFGAAAQGGTPLGAAIWPAATALYGHKAKNAERKILIIITDGMPDTPDYARQMVDRCEASGINVIGLGFGGASATVLARIFNQYCCVGTVDQLRTALFGVVRGVLAA